MQVMAKKLLKDIHDDNGNTKIDFNEIARVKAGKLELLGDISDYIIEQGENDHGHWEKWVSGKLIQYGSKKVTHQGTTEQWGSVYLSDPTTITYPIPFLELYSLNVNLVSMSGLAGWLTQYSQGNPNRLVESPRYSLARPATSTTTTHAQYEYIAIGRWKD